MKNTKIYTALLSLLKVFSNQLKDFLERFSHKKQKKHYVILLLREGAQPGLFTQLVFKPITKTVLIERT